MNINNKTAKLFNNLVGKVPTAILYREVFGMTEEEAEKAVLKGFKEHLRHDSRVEAIYVQKARNDARRACGFRERPGEEVKPMSASGLAQLMGLPIQQPENQEPEEEEL